MPNKRHSIIQYLSTTLLLILLISSSAYASIPNITHSAVSAGRIITKSEVALLSRDTANANRPIADTFDKDKVAEQQELSRVFSEEAFKKVGDIAKAKTKPYEDAQLREATAKTYLELKDKETLTNAEQELLTSYEQDGLNSNNAHSVIEQAKADQQKYQEQYDQWKDGSAIKVALHAIVGGIQANWGGGSIVAGSLAGMTNEALIPVIADHIESQGITPGSKIYGNIMQIATTVVGSAIGSLANSKAGAVTGASVALAGTTNNFLGHQDYAELKRLRAKGKDRTQQENEKLVILEVANQISDELLVKAKSGATLTEDERQNLQVFINAYFKQEGEAETNRLLQSGISPTKDYIYPYGASIEAKTKYAKENVGLFEYLIGRTKTENEKEFYNARTDANMYLNIAPNEDLLPTALARLSDQRLLDSLLNSSLASGTYAASTFLNLGTEEQRRAGASIVSNISDIGLSMMLYKAGLGAAFGSTPDTLIRSTAVQKGETNSLRLANELNAPNEIPVTQNALSIYKEWPGNRGFFSTYRVMGVAQPGQVFSRIGNIDGNYVAPPGTSISARGLPSTYPNQNETLWKVVEPIKYEGGIAAPWKDAKGIGLPPIQ